MSPLSSVISLFFLSYTVYLHREARVIFKAGKNCDGYFDVDDLLQQVDKAIDIFEGLTKGWAQGLFIFDNAPSHQKRAPNAILARNMVKGASTVCILHLLTSLTGPKERWTHHPNGSRMRSGTLPNGDPQSFYFSEDHPSMPGWFKGMEIIIRERGLWPEGEDLLAQCPGFHCPPGHADCCCRRILFLQPDFASQKSQLQELVESRGHLCDFYPKYHCELNFIEQYWGAAKLRFRMAGRAVTINEMEKKVIQCLDDIPLLHIRRCVSFFFLIPFLSPYLHIPLAMQTDLRALYLLTMPVFQDHKLFGQIGNTTATVLYLQRL